MAKGMTKLFTPFAFLLATSLLVSGCGRSGAPLKPSEAAAKEAKANNQPAPARPVPNNQNPDKPFILDRLLQ
ncbi:MAG: hypothetical protein AAFO61_02245 [Pseudomonadota bacterium]